MNTLSSTDVRYYIIVGSRRPSNYIWALIIGFGGLNFLLTGFSSYREQNLLPFIHAENIAFFPQGLVMSFYGLLGLLFCLYLTLTIVWNIGGGFNLLDKQKKIVRIFRWHFPGINRRINLTYALNQIIAIELELTEGWNPKRMIYLCIKDQRKIPLTPVGQLLTVEQMERLAAEMASFLEVPLLNNIL
jgi:hypothetical protein